MAFLAHVAAMAFLAHLCSTARQQYSAVLVFLLRNIFSHLLPAQQSWHVIRQVVVSCVVCLARPRPQCCEAAHCEVLHTWSTDTPPSPQLASLTSDSIESQTSGEGGRMKGGRNARGRRRGGKQGEGEGGMALAVLGWKMKVPKHILHFKTKQT